MVKIGFDAKRAAQNRTGLGNYSRFVLRILAAWAKDAECELYIPNPARERLLGDVAATAAMTKHYPDGWWRRVRSAWRTWGITRRLRADGIDLYHGLSNELPLNIRRGGVPSVVTVHDLIFVHCPQYYKPVDRMLYSYKYRRACLNADRVIAVSRFTKDDIVKYWHIDPDKIDVVYQGCDKAFAADIPAEKLAEVRRRYDLPERFVLFVGSIEERKNAELIVNALWLLKRQGLQVNAVLAGRSTPYCERLKRHVAELGLTDSCRFLHGVPFADLPSVYRLASVFVYPSRIEGFGIPMLEALTSGVPAIGCTGSCLEEAGGPDSVYVDPDDAASLAREIRSLLTDDARRRRMIECGLAYARHFDDERLCADLTAVYRRVLGK